MASSNSNSTNILSVIANSTINNSTPSIAFPNISIKLDRENFFLWRSTIISALETFDLEGFLDDKIIPSSTITVPPSENQTTETTAQNPEFIKWKKLDRLILLWLKSTLSERVLGYVARVSTTHEAWRELSEIFGAQSLARVTQMQDRLRTLQKGSMSIMEYVEQKRLIADNLAEALHPISDKELVSCILLGLDRSYGPFRTSISVRNTPISSAELLGLLLIEEDRLEEENKPLTANIAHRPSNNNHDSGSSNRNTGVVNRGENRHSFRHESKGKRPICQICEKPGHIARECYQRYKDTHPPQRRSHKSANIATQSDITDPYWYFDSGASNHVTADLNKLSLRSEYEGEDRLAVGNGAQLPISHTGSTGQPTSSRHN